MKKIFLFLILFAASWQLPAVWNGAETDKLLNMMKQATDPFGKASEIKSFEVQTECRILNVNCRIKVYFKAPDKLRQEISINDAPPSVRVFDGEKAAEMQSSGEIEIMEEADASAMKISALMSDPAADWKKIFYRFEVADELEIYENRKYIAVSGFFHPESNQTPYKFLVDPDTYLVIYMFKTIYESNIPINSVNHNLEFKTLNNMVIPTRHKLDFLGLKTEASVASFKVNIPYPDTFFRLY